MRLKAIVCSLICLLPIYADDGGVIAEDNGAGVTYEEQGGASYSPQEKAPLGNTMGNKWITFWGDFGFVSDYVYRGQTRTFRGPAAQGSLNIGQGKDAGLYAGVWGSNVSNTLFSNGANVELDLYLGYKYRYTPDLSFALEMRNTIYPGAYASLPTKDKYDQVEIIPSVGYKFFTFLLAYSVTNAPGVNKNFAPTFSTPLTPNGNSKGSWYAEANAILPIAVISNDFKLKLFWGYSYFRNYSKLNYNLVGMGLSYKLPEKWSGAILSINGSTTTANKKYYKLSNSAGKTKNSIGPVVWLGIAKEF